MPTRRLTGSWGEVCRSSTKPRRHLPAHNSIVRQKCASAGQFSAFKDSSDYGISDINFYFNPVCPFAWLTCKWVRSVMTEREYTTDWRFISLRMTSVHIDYHTHFPPEYEAGHTAGLRLLRVAAKARAELGREVVGPLYAALGSRIFDSESPFSRPADTTTGVDPRGPGCCRAGARSGRSARRSGGCAR